MSVPSSLIVFTAAFAVLVAAVQADTLLWQATLNGPASSFTSNSNSVFVLTNSSMQAFSKANGNLLWTVNAFPDGPWGFANLLVAATETTVALYTEFQITLFINAATGAISKQLTAPYAASSIFYESGVFILVGSNAAVAYSATNFSEVWKFYDAQFMGDIFSKPVVSSEFVLLLGTITPPANKSKQQPHDDADSSSSSNGSGSFGPSPVPYLYVINVNTGVASAICNINYISQQPFSGVIGAASSSPLSLAAWDLRTGKTLWNTSLTALLPLLGVGILQTPTAVIIAEAEIFMPVSLTSYSASAGTQQWSTKVVNSSGLTGASISTDGNIVLTISASRNGHTAPEFQKLSSTTGSLMGYVFGVPTTPAHTQVVNGDNTFVLNLQGFTRIDSCTFAASQVLTLPGLTNIGGLGPNGYVVAAGESLYAYQQS